MTNHTQAAKVMSISVNRFIERIVPQIDKDEFENWWLKTLDK